MSHMLGAPVAHDYRSFAHGPSYPMPGGGGNVLVPQGQQTDKQRKMADLQV